MNHEDMTYTEAKDILENYIHTEFFDRKDSDVGQAIVKSIKLLSKESAKETKYGNKEQYNYYNAPKRFCPCPVCGNNRRRFSWGLHTDATSKQNYKCQKCDFTMVVEFPRFTGISDAMVRTCWNKVCELYSNNHRNGHTVIPWVTYGNKKYPLRLEVLYFKNEGENNE